MKTAETVLNEHAPFGMLSRESALSAMQQYAELVSCGFAEWVDENYFRVGNSNIWIVPGEDHIKRTTSELYQQFQLFLTSQKENDGK